MSHGNQYIPGSPYMSYAYPGNPYHGAQVYPAVRQTAYDESAANAVPVILGVCFLLFLAALCALLWRKNRQTRMTGKRKSERKHLLKKRNRRRRRRRSSDGDRDMDGGKSDSYVITGFAYTQ